MVETLVAGLILIVCSLSIMSLIVASPPGWMFVGVAPPLHATGGNHGWSRVPECTGLWTKART